MVVKLSILGVYMGPSQPIVNHLHALWLEQQARKGIVFLRGQLTPEEDAAIRSVISQGEERTIANMLSVSHHVWRYFYA
jgi:hypothetical protein